MGWVGFALLTAFFESAKDVVGKAGLRRADHVVLAWAWRFFALPLVIPVALWDGIPPLDADFAWALLVSGGLNVAAALLYLSALRAGDISLTVPLVSFSPLFLLLTSPLMLDERPGSQAVAGIVLIVTGSYLLHYRSRAGGFLGPFRALLTEAGPRRMLAVAVIWSISANVDKVGVIHSSPLFWSAALNLAIAAGLFPLALPRLRQASLRGPLLPLLGIGFCGGLTTICQMIAISLTLVPHVIAMKRTSTVLSTLWGHLLFAEPEPGRRLGGALIMLAGAVLVILS